MFRTKRLNDPPTVPYLVKYGPRSGQRSGGPTSVVDHSFLRPREGLDVSKLTDLDSEWVEAMKYVIKTFSCKD